MSRMKYLAELVKCFEAEMSYYYQVPGALSLFRINRKTVVRNRELLVVYEKDE